MPRVIVQQGASVFLIHIGDIRVSSGHRVPLARVYDRARGQLFPEMYRDSIAKFGGWVEFEGSGRERDAIERDVVGRLALRRRTTPLAE